MTLTWRINPLAYSFAKPWIAACKWKPWTLAVRCSYRWAARAAAFASSVPACPTQTIPSWLWSHLFLSICCGGCGGGSLFSSGTVMGTWLFWWEWGTEAARIGHVVCIHWVLLLARSLGSACRLCFWPCACFLGKHLRICRGHHFLCTVRRWSFRFRLHRCTPLTNQSDS